MSTVITTLNVSGLASEVTEADIRRLFSSSGVVTSVSIKRQPNTKKSLGYAYVSFQTKEHATNAMESLNGQRLHSQPMSIEWASTNSSTKSPSSMTVIVRKFNADITNEALKQVMESAGQVANVKMISTDAGGVNTAKVQYTTAEAAFKATTELNMQATAVGSISVEFAVRKQPDVVDDSCRLYVSKLPENWEEVDVTQWMKEFNPVSVSVCVNRTKNAYVSFKNAEDTENCRARLHGSVAGSHSEAVVSVVSYCANATQRVRQPQVPLSQNPSEIIFQYASHVSAPLLRDLCGAFGEVVDVVRDERPNAGRDSYRVTFSNAACAKRAKSELNGFEFSGKALRVFRCEENRVANPHGSNHYSRGQRPQPMHVAPVNHAEERQRVGNELYAKLQLLGIKDSEKVTGMMLDLGSQEVAKLLSSDEVLKAKALEALEVIKQSQAQQ